MPYLMGIDLGTSSVKALVLDEAGRELGLAGETYDIAVPRPRWAEQHPEGWWERTAVAAGRALRESGVPPDEVAAVAFSRYLPRKQGHFQAVAFF